MAIARDIANLRARAIDVVHCHFSHDHALARLAGPRGAVLVRSIHAPRSLRWSTPRADAWTVPTEALAEAMEGAPVLVLPPLVDPGFTPGDREVLRASLCLPAGRLVGMVSTFQASRRHDVALEAFARVAQRHADAHLVLVGDGALEATLRQQVASLGLAARVHFTGYQQGPRFVQHLQALDEVWILGLGNDFSGRAAAQARACGVRVVAVDEGALGLNADQLVACDPGELAVAALSGKRREVAIEPVASVADRVTELYEQARRMVAR
jgi:glycosyltransferase involved in cell wall biosynthesis